MKSPKKLLLLLLIGFSCLLAAASCGDDDDDNDASDDDDGTGPLTLTVVVKPAPTDNPLAREIQIVSSAPCSLAGRVTASDEPGALFSDPVASEQGTEHSLWFYGLLSDTTFAYEITTTDDPSEVLDEGTFDVPALPVWAPQPTEVVNTDDADRTTWIAMSINTVDNEGASAGLIVVVDRQARYRLFHQTRIYPGMLHHPFLEGLVLLKNGDLAWNNRTDMVAASPNGDEYLLFDVTLDTPHLETSHHQAWVFENEPMTALVLFNLFSDGVQCDLTTPTEMTVGDGVARLDPDGRELWRWTVFDSADDIPPESLSPCDCDGGFWGPGTYDFTHANSVWSVDDGDAFLISMRNLSRIVKVDAQTGDVIWQIGRGLDFTWVGTEAQENRWFSFQHDAQWLGENRLLVFDNHIGHLIPCSHSPWSRAIEFEVDQLAMTVKMVWEHHVPYAAANGNNERMANGNTLISGGWNRRLVEATPQGDEVWTFQFPMELHNLSTGRTYPATWNYNAD